MFKSKAHANVLGCSMYAALLTLLGVLADDEHRGLLLIVFLILTGIAIWAGRSVLKERAAKRTVARPASNASYPRGDHSSEPSRSPYEPEWMSRMSGEEHAQARVNFKEEFWGEDVSGHDLPDKDDDD